MVTLFNTYVYQPILWLLVFIYQNLSFHDLGLAIVILTVLVRLVLLPIFYKGAKDQTIIQKIQPHVKKIQLDHKDDKEKQAKELMALYQKHHVNPFSSILFLIIRTDHHAQGQSHVGHLVGRHTCRGDRHGRDCHGANQVRTIDNFNLEGIMAAPDRGLRLDHLAVRQTEIHTVKPIPEF